MLKGPFEVQKLQDGGFRIMSGIEEGPHDNVPDPESGLEEFIAVNPRQRIICTVHGDDMAPVADTLLQALENEYREPPDDGLPKVKLTYRGGGCCDGGTKIEVGGKPLLGVTKATLVLDCNSEQLPSLTLDFSGHSADVFAHPAIGKVVTDRINKLETAIRKHRVATTGQGMCWENDRELWRVLGEEDKVDHRPPGWLSFLWNCIRYRWSRRGTPCPCGFTPLAPKGEGKFLVCRNNGNPLD